MTAWEELAKMDDADQMFDLAIAGAYFAGNFNGKVPVDESRKVFKRIKELLGKEREDEYETYDDEEFVCWRCGGEGWCEVDVDWDKNMLISTRREENRAFKKFIQENAKDINLGTLKNMQGVVKAEQVKLAKKYAEMDVMLDLMQTEVASPTTSGGCDE